MRIDDPLFRAGLFVGYQVEKARNTERGEMTSALNNSRSELESHKNKSIGDEAVVTISDALGQWESIPVQDKKSILRQWIERVEVGHSAGNSDITVKVVYRRERSGV